MRKAGDVGTVARARAAQSKHALLSVEENSGEQTRTLVDAEARRVGVVVDKRIVGADVRAGEADFDIVAVDSQRGDAAVRGIDSFWNVACSAELRHNVDHFWRRTTADRERHRSRHRAWGQRTVLHAVGRVHWLRAGFGRKNVRATASIWTLAVRAIARFEIDTVSHWSK